MFSLFSCGPKEPPRSPEPVQPVEPVEVAAPEAPPEPRLPPEPPNKSRMLILMLLTYSDGSVKEGHVIRLERSEGFCSMKSV